MGRSDDEADLVRRGLVPLAAEIVAEPQRLSIDLRRTVCIVVDMQSDFCAPEAGSIISASARRPIAPMQRILPQLRRKVERVIWLNWGNRPDRLNLSPALLHVYKPYGRCVGLGDPLPEQWRPGAGEGKLGSQHRRRVCPESGDIHVDKYPDERFLRDAARQHPA
jgi:nicotinamidase-related amidase